MPELTYADSRQRYFVRILRELCQEEGWAVSFFSQDWIARLSDAHSVHWVYGYQFDLNSVTAQMLALDKAATYTLLTDAGLAAVAHQLFVQPEATGWVSEEGVWESLHAYARAHRFRVVAKPNRGTRGQEVYFVQNPRDLEAAAHRLWQLDRSFCLSPWLEIATEYRLLVLDDAILLAYAKDIPMLIADGQQTHQALFAAAQHPIPTHLNPKEIPNRGTLIPVLQKNNLSGGAKPRLLTNIPHQLQSLVLKAAHTIGIRFASVDVIQTSDGEQMVLEINSGLLGRSFIEQAPDGYAIAKMVYRQVLRKVFEEGKN
ncbi:MAG: RimK family alpha-L-glutamate ligase [Bernardetiaceae bacterium]